MNSWNNNIDGVDLEVFRNSINGGSFHTRTLDGQQRHWVCGSDMVADMPLPDGEQTKLRNVVLQVGDMWHDEIPTSRVDLSIDDAKVLIRLLTESLERVESGG